MGERVQTITDVCNLVNTTHTDKHRHCCHVMSHTLQCNTIICSQRMVAMLYCLSLLSEGTIPYIEDVYQRPLSDCALVSEECVSVCGVCVWL